MQDVFHVIHAQRDVITFSVTSILQAKTVLNFDISSVHFVLGDVLPLDKSTYFMLFHRVLRLN